MKTILRWKTELDSAPLWKQWTVIALWILAGAVWLAIEWTYELL